MAVYLEKFVLPNKGKEEELIVRRMSYNGGTFGYIDNLYPCGLFSEKELSEIDFSGITIFYGGNGSGKSTLLNLIANKLCLKRTAPYNTSELFNSFVESCKFRLGYDDEGDEYRDVPQKSSIITSDDIFDYMLTARENNQEVSEDTRELHDDVYGQLKYGKTIRLGGIEDYEDVRLQVLARKKSLSRRQFLYKVAGKEVKLNSNGETALDYFDTKLHDNSLYCLDEPENSLSPKYQKELVEIISQKARYGGCQFIIATHSPFVLSLIGAKIYDLDTIPVNLKNWWELENTKTYFDFFEENRHLFKKQ